MKKKKLILLATTCLGLGTSAAVSNATVNAKTVKYEQVKTKKHVAKKHVIKKKANKSAKKLTKKSTTTQTKQTNIVNGYDATNGKVIDTTTFTNVATQTSLNKLNEFRSEKGLPTLILDNNLTKIAQIRAQQRVNQGWTLSSPEAAHYDTDGTPFAFEVANQLGLNSYQNNALWGENAGEYNVSDFNDTVDLGNTSVQDAIDEGPTGGHYQNIANSNFTKCGIGFYVKDSDDIGYVLELQ